MRERFLTWWRAPVTEKDRKVGSIVGGFGFFWIGILGRLLIGPQPVTLDVLAWWALGSMAIGIVLGGIFPKATTCIAYPFSITGIGSGI